MRVPLAAFAVLGLAASATAQPAPPPAPPPPSRCEAMSAAIRSAVQEMSYITGQDVLDRRSAPRASMRAERIGNLQAVVQSRITIMGSSQCAPYDGPLDPNAFGQAAMMCLDAEEFGYFQRSGGPRISKEVACDRAKWKPNPGAF